MCVCVFVWQGGGLGWGVRERHGHRCQNQACRRIGLRVGGRTEAQLRARKHQLHAGAGSSHGFFWICTQLVQPGAACCQADVSIMPRSCVQSSQQRRATTQPRCAPPCNAGVYTSWECGPEPGEQAPAAVPGQEPGAKHATRPCVAALHGSRQGVHHGQPLSSACANLMPPCAPSAGSYLAIVELVSIDMEGNVVRQATACEYGFVYNDQLRNTW